MQGLKQNSLLLQQDLDVRLADGREHGADLGHQRVRVRVERQRVLKLLVQMRHPAWYRAASRCEAQSPAQHWTLLRRSKSTSVLYIKASLYFRLDYINRFFFSIAEEPRHMVHLTVSRGR